MSSNSGTTSRWIKGAALVGAGALGATILTGVAYAQNNSAADVRSVTATALDGERGHGGPGGPGGRDGGRGFGHGGPGGPGGEVLHSEATVETPDGTIENVRTVRGEVTAVSAESITVRASDGFEQAFAINAETEINKSRDEATATDIAVGDVAMVKGVGSGDTVTAERIHAMTAEEAATMEAEREQRRADMLDEMRQRLQEMEQEQGANPTS